MDTFSCQRCGYESFRKTDFLRHLSRKYPCRPKLQDVSVEELLRNYFGQNVTFKKLQNPTQTHTNPHKPTQTHTNPHKPTQIHADEMDPKVSLEKTYLCKYCDLEFSRADSLKRHMDKFCKKNITGEIEALDSQLALKERQLRLQKVDRKLQGTTTQMIVGDNNNNTNNTNNTQINNKIDNVTVNILPYENTDVSHLTDRDYQRAFNRASMCIPQILEKVHFDPEKPENHNVYISSMNNKYIKLHNGERWNLRDREETIEDLFADAEYMLENKLETWQEEEDPKSERATKKFEIYLKVKETETLYNKIKQELKMLLFNNRNLITEE